MAHQWEELEQKLAEETKTLDSTTKSLTMSVSTLGKAVMLKAFQGVHFQPCIVLMRILPT